MGKRDRPRTINELSRGELAKLAADGWWPFEPAQIAPGSAVRPPAGVYAIWMNNRYSVQVSDVQTAWGRVVHLWVRRHDGAAVRSWADLQRIKNEILVDGRERVAVEVFPADADLVDAANMYHLWVFAPGFRLPFSLKAGAGESEGAP